MADYRFSAQVISRGKGQSSVASAAYRAASRLVDERTGETHDYARKGGLVHAEILAPDQTPDWMLDRAQLWNAVEAVERRKDAQLAREVQLSLPHELTPEQRRALVSGFVLEQFVGRGMIADVAIHAPSQKGDERNHHAHIMLTMRELTGGAFGKKNRDWNDPEQLKEWREQWARHQNRALERHGHAERVDHRSYEDQGIDREPTHHLGPNAHDMEANGKPSRIGDENREIDAANSKRADQHREAMKVQRAIEVERSRFEGWAHFKRTELENAQQLSTLDFEQRQDRQKSMLEARLQETYGEGRATLAKQAETITRRLEATGVRKILRNLFGRSTTDRTQLENIERTLADINMREDSERAKLAAFQAQERAGELRRQSGRRQQLEQGIDKARERRQREGWKPLPKRPEKAAERTRGKQAARSADEARKAATRDPEPIKPEWQRKSIDQREREDREDKQRRGELSRPWERASFGNDNSRPWERNSERDREHGRSRGRKPTPDGGESDDSST